MHGVYCHHAAAAGQPESPVQGLVNHLERRVAEIHPAVCHILLGLAPLLQQYADGAAAQREHVHTLEGTLSVQHAMGLADAMAKLAAIMIRSAAARRAHATLQLRGETQQH